MVRRRGVSCACLASAAALLAACGKSNPPAVSSEQLRAFASAVNLTASDTAGMRKVPNGLRSPEGEEPANSCPSLATADTIYSPVFAAAKWEAFSLVARTPSPAAAAEYITELTTGTGRTCFSPPAAGRSPETLIRISAPLPPGARYVGIRVSEPYEEPYPHVEVDMYFFAAGRGIVALGTLGYDAPAPSAAEHRLVRLLYIRAEAHRL
jgi:hypothetical protein